MIDIIGELKEADQSKHLNIMRLLILLSALALRYDRSPPIISFSQLAKLDFLLRYPTVLESALLNRRKSIDGLNIEKNEKENIESEMVRYDFGPWDEGYREYIRVLAAKGLVDVVLQEKEPGVVCTETGIEVSQRLQENSDFLPFYERSKIILTRLSISDKQLTNLIYEAHPQILTLKPKEFIFL